MGVLEVLYLGTIVSETSMCTPTHCHIAGIPLRPPDRLSDRQMLEVQLSYTDFEV